MKEIAVLLHNVRSSHNVGSIFRTADGAGASCVILTGYTPTPIDRFGRAAKDIAKTALGAEKTLPWLHYTSLTRAINDLKNDGWYIVAVEQDARAIDHRTFAPRHKTVLVFGNEVRGLSKGNLTLCDEVVEIEMHGKKESLNVSVAAGVALFSLRVQ